MTKPKALSQLLCPYCPDNGANPKEHGLTDLLRWVSQVTGTDLSQIEIISSLR
jgi:hypothetical protein